MLGVNISIFVAVVHVPWLMNISVGFMTSLPHAVSNYARTGNVTAKPRHEYHFLFSKRTGVLV